MKDTLGTLLGFLIGTGLVFFGIVFPDHLSNYYVYKMTDWEHQIEQMEDSGAPRSQIDAIKKEIEVFKKSMVGSIARFADLKSFGIVAGGAFAALLIAFPFGKAMKSFVFVAQALGKDKMQEEFLDVYETVLALAEKRANNEIITDAEIDAINNDYLRTWVQDFIAVDVVSEDMITEIIESEIAMYDYRSMGEIHVLEFLGKAAPAFGMVGTVVGLILMLSSAGGANTKISDVMGAMSVALITTLYGVLMAQLLFLPVASKRFQLKESNIKLLEMIQESLLYLKNRELPDVAGQDLIIYLPPKLRERVEEARLSGGGLGL